MLGNQYCMLCCTHAQFWMMEEMLEGDVLANPSWNHQVVWMFTMDHLAIEHSTLFHRCMDDLAGHHNAELH